MYINACLNAMSFGIVRYRKIVFHESICVLYCTGTFDGAYIYVSTIRDHPIFFHFFPSPDFDACLSFFVTPLIQPVFYALDLPVCGRCNL